ncbi:hypothetical protein HCD_03550 [Helicobacter cetorum MIT 99-5656]|uniref:Dentin sialophosphopreproprotein n=1 Tax=Helicobacter cetorum (strain ATCC BAA-540 / CCUG 52418 / MIT 99-5656) TaxID=1163745 RepID=I0ES07_HELCM|nr:hypothetical protein [Helicobacter cetorum]AFI05726.1 hypothetical protein HCD_03550 [Helicobacter cetorum MIT 99-5656]
MRVVKILFIVVLSLKATSLNKALFDLKDSHLKGELVSKVVDIGGWKGNTKEWGATALNYINVANGDAKKFSELVEKMRFGSNLGGLRTHAYLKQALKLQKDLRYNLKIIARNSFYSYRTGIYIPLGVSLKDQEVAQKMLADLSVVGVYLKQQENEQNQNTRFYRSNMNHHNFINYYSPYYGMYGFYYGMYGFYPNLVLMAQIQDYLMLENYLYALNKEESLEHENHLNDTYDNDNDDTKDLEHTNLMGYYRGTMKEHDNKDTTQNTSTSQDTLQDKRQDKMQDLKQTTETAHDTERSDTDTHSIDSTDTTTTETHSDDTNNTTTDKEMTDTITTPTQDNSDATTDQTTDTDDTPNDPTDENPGGDDSVDMGDMNDMEAY